MICLDQESKLNRTACYWPGYLTVLDSWGPGESCTVRYPGSGIMHSEVSWLIARVIVQRTATTPLRQNSDICNKDISDRPTFQVSVPQTR